VSEVDVSAFPEFRALMRPGISKVLRELRIEFDQR
jgi:hypothetical protein